MVRLEIDNSFARLVGRLHPSPDVEAGIHAALRQELGYTPPGVEYSPKYKTGQWDGIVSLYQKRGQSMPAGLAFKARDVLKEYDVDVEVVDLRPPVVRNLNAATKFGAMGRELRPYQREAVDLVKQKGRGVIALFTGAGKTQLSCEMIAELGAAPVVFIVPSKGLMHQTAREFRKWLVVDGKEPVIGLVGDGHCSPNANGLNVMIYHSGLASFDLSYNAAKDRVEDNPFAGDRVKKTTPELEAAHHAARLAHTRAVEKYGNPAKGKHESVKESKKALDKAKASYDARIRLTENKRRVRDLIESAQVAIVDEAHLAAVVIQTILEKAGKARYRVGMSVAPDSVVDLRGGPYGSGFVGAIEDAYERGAAADGSRRDRVEGYDVVHLPEGVETRGWTGDGFGWKPVPRIIRHACDKPCVAIRAGGTTLTMTDDHSVFRLEGDAGKNPVLACPPASDIARGDVLLHDDGREWGGGCDFAPIPWEAALRVSGKNLSKARVAVPFCSLSKKDLGIHQRHFWQLRTRSQHGPTLSYEQYDVHRRVVGKPTRLYTDSACGVGIDPGTNLLDWAYVLGYFLGDGWLDGNRVVFAINRNDLEDFVDALAATPGIHCESKIREMPGDSVELSLCCAPLAWVFRYLFKSAKAWEKTIPSDWIVSWPEHGRRRLLQGLLDSDGHRTARGDGAYVTTSKGLAQGTRALLRSLSVVATVSVARPKAGGVGEGRQITGRRDRYTVTWSGNAERGEHDGRKGHRKRFAHAEAKFHECVARESLPCVETPEYVYDLEVQGHPSFSVDGILCHNSATPWREDNQEIRIQASTGKSLIYIPVQDGVKLGYLTPVKTFFVADELVEFSEGWREVYQKHIVDNWTRNWRIKRLAEEFKAAGSPVIVLVDELPHGDFLESIIQDSVFVSGSDEGDDLDTDDDRDYRKVILDEVESNKTIMIATSWADQGIDAPKARVLILAGSGTSTSKYLQRVGRVARVVGKDIEESIRNGKPDCVVIDFQMAQPALKKHSNVRKRVAKESEFEVVGVR